MATTRAVPRRAASVVAPWAGLAVAALLLVAAFVLPAVTGWDVHARSDRAAATSGSLAPLHGFWDPRLFGPGTIPAVVIALLGWRYAVDAAERLPWRRLLVVGYVV